ncbi:type II secretion system F family protein [bacterium]|nr:type II secretion system F family protein [bacterium]
MPIFQYEAMDTSGGVVKDTIEAPTADDAHQKIRQKGFYVTKLAERGKKKTKKTAGAKKGGPKRKKTFSIGGVSAKHLSLFTRQLSTLQDAGLPVVRSLRILDQQAKPGPLKNTLGDVIEDIESGMTLSDSMRKHPKVFDNLYVNMIKAGEAGGALEVILQRLSEFKEKAQSLKRKVKGAMIYPVVVVIIAIGILTFILIWIVPQFQKIFSDFGVELPAMTQVLIKASSFAARYFWVGPIVVIVWWLILKLIKRFKYGRWALDWMWLRTPVFGPLSRMVIVARTMRTLGTLIASGVPILESIIICRETSQNMVYEKAYQKVHDSIREGESIASPLRETKAVSEIVVNMIDVGEETGDLDSMLMKVADNYDEEVDTMVTGMVALIQPLLVVFLGGMIGFIVIALFLPLIKLINSLSGGKG